MKRLLFSVFCGLVLNIAAQENGAFDTENQQWGYVEVRPGAQIFWWLFHTTASKNITEKPLIIVIAGGPGIAASYLNNFKEVGPLNENLEPRNSSWVHSANVLFVDSPVGTGFSSVKSDSLHATTDEQVAEDFVNFLRGFYKAVPDFENVPVYIASSGYGGKAAVTVADKIDQSVKNNILTINLKGIALESSWISPVNNILFIPAYLYELGYVDTQKFDELNSYTEKVQTLTKANKWTESLATLLELIEKMESLTDDTNIYNLLNTKKYNFNTTSEDRNLMEKVKTGLKLNTTFNGVYNTKVFNALAAEYNKPAVEVLERLLNDTDVSIAAYNGQLDLFTNILGAHNWLLNLNFKGFETYWGNSSLGTEINIDGITEGEKRGTGKLSFYAVLRAGHFVVRDNPKAVHYILEKITDKFRV